MRRTTLRRRKFRAPRLNLAPLERRDNPALPAGVGGFLSLLDVYAVDGGYTETHTSTSDFDSTATQDESGTAASGTFTLVIDGEAHGTDNGNGSGNGTVAFGHTTGDLVYHAVYHGHNDNGIQVFDDVTFTATEHHTSSDDITYDYNGPDYPSYHSHYLGTLDANGTVTFTAVQVDGQWSLTSYTGSSDSHMHQETQWNSGSGESGWSTSDSGYTESDSYAGSTAVHASGSSWDSYHWSHTYPGDPPHTESGGHDNNTPFDQTVDYLPDLPWDTYGSWHAEDPNAVNYTWHGVTTTEGHLTQTVSLNGLRFDIPSFTISGREWDSAHLVEDEPGDGSGGGGDELYHKDELYEGGSNWSGGGSRVDGVYSGSYQVDEDADFAAHNTLGVTDSYSAGTDDEGYPYEQMFNYFNDRTSNGTYHVSHNYDDFDDGALVTQSLSNFSDGTTRTAHYWGTRDGQPIDSTYTTGESHGGTATLPAATRRADWALPAAQGPVGGVDAGLMLCQYVPPTTPPTIPGVPHPGGGLRTGAGLLQGYYNNKIMAIGEDAKKKVAKLVGQDWVLKEMNDEATINGGIRYTTGTFRHAGKGQTFAQAVGRGKELDRTIKNSTENLSKIYNGVATTVDVEISYFVEPPPAAGQNRSGKVVIQYRLIVNFTGTNKRTGRVVSGVAATIGGDGWFQDDGLKTTDLRDR